MEIKIGYDIVFEFPVPTPMVLMLNTHPSREKSLLTPDQVHVEPNVPLTEYFDSFGNRCNRLIAPAERMRLTNEALVTDSGLPDTRDRNAPQIPIEELPDECLQFLLSSRYCEVDQMLPVAWDLFGHTRPNGERVQAICDWVHDNIEFGYKYARPTKTALDVYHERRGVCRDFTHLAVTLCRCLNIPARYCNGYLGDIGMPYNPDPMDFNAWFEVYLGGRWHTYDARHNEPRIGRVLMTRGRDAVDIAMTTAFGSNKLVQFTVITEEMHSQAQALLKAA